MKHNLMHIQLIEWRLIWRYYTHMILKNDEIMIYNKVDF